jgi:hypothetical protein
MIGRPLDDDCANLRACLELFAVLALILDMVRAWLTEVYHLAAHLDMRRDVAVLGVRAQCSVVDVVLFVRSAEVAAQDEWVLTEDGNRWSLLNGVL